jgi:hypothetical protein
MDTKAVIYFGIKEAHRNPARLLAIIIHLYIPVQTELIGNSRLSHSNGDFNSDLIVGGRVTRRGVILAPEA